MKKYLIILIAAIFFAQAQSLAQTDSRNRTPETVIADALAQMPAKDSRSYSLLMGEMASTGSAGILQIASTMNYDDGKASAGAYALQGLASYVMPPEGGRHRDEVRKGLKLAIGRSGDVRKKRFLIASLALCATPADLPDLIAIANDKELEDAAVDAISGMKDSGGAIAAFVRTSAAERAVLAILIKSCGLTECSDLLASWTDGADDATMAAIYDAIAAVAPADMLPILAEAAQSAGYKPEGTRSTDAFIKMLERICDDDKAVVGKEARRLMKSETSAIRCAGLRLALRAEGTDGIKTFIKALRDSDAAYRNTALEYGPEYCGPTAFDAMAKAMARLP